MRILIGILTLLLTSLGCGGDVDVFTQMIDESARNSTTRDDARQDGERSSWSKGVYDNIFDNDTLHYENSTGITRIAAQDVKISLVRILAADGNFDTAGNIASRASSEWLRDTCFKQLVEAHPNSKLDSSDDWEKYVDRIQSPFIRLQALRARALSSSANELQGSTLLPKLRSTLINSQVSTQQATLLSASDIAMGWSDYAAVAQRVGDKKEVETALEMIFEICKSNQIGSSYLATIVPSIYGLCEEDRFVMLFSTQEAASYSVRSIKTFNARLLKRLLALEKSRKMKLLVLGEQLANEWSVEDNEPLLNELLRELHEELGSATEQDKQWLLQYGVVSICKALIKNDQIDVLGRILDTCETVLSKIGIEFRLKYFRDVANLPWPEAYVDYRNKYFKKAVDLTNTGFAGSGMFRSAAIGMLVDDAVRLGKYEQAIDLLNGVPVGTDRTLNSMPILEDAWVRKDAVFMSKAVKKLGILSQHDLRDIAERLLSTSINHPEAPNALPLVGLLHPDERELAILMYKVKRQERGKLPVTTPVD